MNMPKAALVSTQQELHEILQLQEKNLPENLSVDEFRSQGFVTIHHDLHLLNTMHQLAPSVIIKDKDQVIAYALTMLGECSRLVPGLISMFSLLDSCNWQNKSLSKIPYYVMGQVCVEKKHRGRGLFDALYAHHKKTYSSRFDLLVTQISVRNPRSTKAHERVGFKTIHQHRDKQDEWLVVAWDWS
jgi:hypothetical protein